MVTFVLTAVVVIFINIALKAELNILLILSLSLVNAVYQMLSPIRNQHVRGALIFYETDEGELMVRIKTEEDPRILYASGDKYILMQIIDKVQEVNE
jgi:hypothetical protein